MFEYYTEARRMTERGWSPDDEAREKSKKAQEVVSMLEDESLERLRDMAESSGSDIEAARSERQSRPDLRMDTTAEEQDQANRSTDIWTYALVGIAIAIVLVGAAFGLGWDLLT
jgi:anti-sigma-K factor RskA